MNPQDSQSELEFWEGMFGKSTNAKGNAEGYITYADFTKRLEAYVTTRVKEALEAARSKDPHLCQFGHKVYSHKTVDGWCCACESDQAFMEAEIEARVKEAERLARLSELSALDKSEIANQSMKKMQIRIKGRIEALTTTTNGKGK